jgi:hypothetical protein
MTTSSLLPVLGLQTIQWPDRREIPCRDMDLDCFAFDGIVPFGDYARCQAYAPELGRCIFLGEERGGCTE